MLKNNLAYIPKAVESLFTTNSDIHKYNTRNRDKMRSAYGKHEFMYSNFRFVGIHIWNYILDHLDINVTLPKFKKKHLKQIFWLIILHIIFSSQPSMFSYLFIKISFISSIYYSFLFNFCLTLYIIYSLLYCTYQSNLLTMFKYVSQ